MDYKLIQTGAQVQEILDDAPITQQELEAVEALLPEGVSTGNKLVDYKQMNTLLQAKQDKLTEQTTGTKVGDLSVKYGVNIGYGVTVGSDNQTKVTITPGSITKGQGANIFDALATIETVIPSAASAQNKLTDKNYVDSAIATSSANFVGTFNSLAELQAVQNPTNNDYGFVIETDAQGNEYYDRYKYNGSQWLFEYKVESTPFTADQWAAIQSGITSALVTKLNALPTAQQLNSQLAGKQDTISDIATIRSGAASGATAVQPAALQSGLATKQDTITDLAAIRSGAAAGATAAANTGDKAYDAAAFSGLGRKNLPKNITTVGGTEKNVLTQAMVNTANTIYVIQYDYDLNGQTITLPAGCVLKFEGGSIKNGTITGNDTDIVADGNVQIFDGVAFGGSFIIEKVSVKWFGAKGDGASADTKPIQEALDFVCDANVSKICYIPNGVYLLPPTGPISSGSPYNYHLWLKDSITIIGEDKYNTILKRVLPDLSEPTQEAYAVKVETGAMIYYITTNTTDVNAVFSVQNLTMDGNENWNHYGFSHYRNTCISTVADAGHRLANNVFRSLVCKNTCDEGIHLEAVTPSSIATATDCNFYNIGGCGGNLGGGKVTYERCSFERTFLEHGWPWKGDDPDNYLIVRDCSFKNHAGSYLSSDYQGTLVDDFNVGKKVIVERCQFITTEDFVAEVNAITSGNLNIRPLIGVYVGNCEMAIIRGCEFLNASYRYGKGGRIVYTKQSTQKIKNLIIEGNYFLSTLDYGGVGTTNALNIAINGNVTYSQKGINYDGVEENTSVMYADVLTASTNNVVEFDKYIGASLIAKVKITNDSGAEAQVTIRQRGVSNSTRGYVQKNFPTGISTEYIAFSAEQKNSFLFVTPATGVSYSLVINPCEHLDLSLQNLTIASTCRLTHINSTSQILTAWNGTKMVDAYGRTIAKHFGTSSYRTNILTSLLTSDDIGFGFFDMTLGFYVAWNGTAWIDSNGDDADRQKAISIQSASSLNAVADTIYTIEGTVTNLAVTLPTVTSGKPRFVEIFITTGSNPNVTFSAGSTPISFFSGNSIAAATSYEINALFNGTKWVIGYAVIA